MQGPFDALSHSNVRLDSTPGAAVNDSNDFARLVDESILSALKAAPPGPISAPGSSRKFGVHSGTPGRRPVGSLVAAGILADTPLQASALANTPATLPIAAHDAKASAGNALYDSVAPAPSDPFHGASQAAPAPQSQPQQQCHWVQLFGMPASAAAQAAIVAALDASCGPVACTAPSRQALSLLVGFTARGGAEAAAAQDGCDFPVGSAEGQAGVVVLGARLCAPPAPGTLLVRGTGRGKGGGETVALRTRSACLAPASYTPLTTIPPPLADALYWGRPRACLAAPVLRKPPRLQPAPRPLVALPHPRRVYGDPPAARE